MVKFFLATAGLFHPFSPHEGSWWVIEPGITLGLSGLTLLYLLAVGPLRRRLGGPAQLDRRHAAFFLSAILIMFVSLQGPLHELSDYYSFSAHMLQHLLVTLIVPPLLLKGIPAWLIDPVIRLPYLFPLARFITSPFIAFTLFNVVFSLWHSPGFYQRALGQPAVHSLEHMLFMSTAILTWWPIFSPTSLLPRLNDPLQMLYLFAQSLIPTVLGAIITFADIVLYPYYAAAPRVIGLSPLDDQQAAGLLMWLGGATIVLLVLTHRFFRWMELDAEDGREAPRAV
jgi:cytochrome c oxidase assembly factor CtaG